MQDIFPNNDVTELSTCQALDAALNEITHALQEALDANNISHDAFNTMQVLVNDVISINNSYEKVFAPETVHYAYNVTSKCLCDYDFDALSNANLQEIQSILYVGTMASMNIENMLSHPVYKLEDLLDEETLLSDKLNESVKAISSTLENIAHNLDPLKDFIKVCNVDLSVDANTKYLKTYLRNHQEAFFDAVAKMVAVESAFTYKIQAKHYQECQSHTQDMPFFLKHLGVKETTIDSKLMDRELLTSRFLPTFTLTLETKKFGIGGRFTNVPITGDLDIKLDTSITNAKDLYSHELLHFFSNYNKLPLDALIRSKWDWSVIGVTNQQVSGIDLYKGAQPNRIFEVGKFNPEAGHYLNVANEAITELLTTIYGLCKSNQLKMNELSSLENMIRENSELIIQQQISDYKPLVEQLIRYVNCSDAHVSISELVSAYFDKESLIELFRKEQGAAISDFLMSFEGVKP